VLSNGRNYDMILSWLKRNLEAIFQYRYIFIEFTLSESQYGANGFVSIST
jgi:hypothetical protein